MTASRLNSAPHRRKNVLTGDYVLVSPQRAKRPWQGALERPAAPKRPSYDPDCYLCPGNERANGETNPQYETVFAFDNDFPALIETGERPGNGDGELFVAEPESGRGRVICFSPRHDRTLADMAHDDIVSVVRLWQSEYEALGALPDINHVQIFENKGEAMGCSNPHPHGQVWAQCSIPNEPAKELANMRNYRDRKGSTLLGDYVASELEREERIVIRNEHFVALVPFWAAWPFECLVLPLQHRVSLSDMRDSELGALADIIGRLTATYDALFDVSFPYSSGIHQAPTDGLGHDYCTFHMHFYPPLLRSASVKKFMVGYEMLAEAQRDITPESSAGLLRNCVPA